MEAEEGREHDGQEAENGMLPSLCSLKCLGAGDPELNPRPQVLLGIL